LEIHSYCLSEELHLDGIFAALRIAYLRVGVFLAKKKLCLQQLTGGVGAL